MDQVSALTAAASAVPAAGVASAEAALRARYGAPLSGDKPNSKAVGFEIPDGRQIALQRDVSAITVWIEAGGSAAGPPVGDVAAYGAEQGRHSNLPPRLKHDPGASLRALGFPRPVASVKLDGTDALAQLLDWYDACRPGPDRTVLERLKQLFLIAYPDFLPGAFPDGAGKFHADEDAYKRQLVERVRALVEAASSDEAALGSGILDVLLGRDHNLLGNYRTNELLRAVRASHPGVLEVATGRLARDSGPPEDAAARFVEATWPALSTGREASMPYAESRVLPTLVLALVRPHEAILVRYQPFYNAGTLLLGRSPFGNGPLTRAEYATVLDLSRAIFAVMRDTWGWQPRDLFDVQGFIWVTCRDRAAVLTSATAQEVTVPAAASEPTNLILYGPPGTGKTFATAAEAVRLCDGAVPPDRPTLMGRYRELCGLGQIAFVTFHQSYAYEDFIEGLRPHQGGGEDGGTLGAGFRLIPEPGVFTRHARSASVSRGSSREHFDFGDRRVFKMSIGEAANPNDDYLFDEAIESGRILLGWGDKVDWAPDAYQSRDAMIEAWRPYHPADQPPLSGHSGYIKFPYTLRNRVRPGDLVIVSKGNGLFRAIAEVVGPYEWRPRPEDDKANTRTVRWLWVDHAGAPVESIYAKSFAQGSLYELSRGELNLPVLERYITTGTEPDDAAAPLPFVLIIDEINRANISKVFGELITLIEPDKRLGALNELKVQLPYSREWFGVPSNLHIIGTMNTADRSIALLDTALRRRFAFRELMPEPEHLPPEVDGVPLRNLLRALNERIEYLFDREHQIGHAYFIGCTTRDAIDAVMRTKVIPLLSEYFYEDWSRVALVLGDADAKPGEGRFVIRTELKAPAGLDADDVGSPRYRWQVRETFPDDAYAPFA